MYIISFLPSPHLVSLPAKVIFSEDEGGGLAKELLRWGDITSAICALELPWDLSAVFLDITTQSCCQQ